MHNFGDVIGLLEKKLNIALGWIRGQWDKRRTAFLLQLWIAIEYLRLYPVQILEGWYKVLEETV